MAYSLQSQNDVNRSSAGPMKGSSFSGLSTVQHKRNHTGLPDNLKAGIENLSGYSMDDVKVHYNSAKPTQLQAHAYAQGTDIHLAPGQEKHLPHEAWHVVQQKQGRVRPTMQMKGKVNVNDDAGLEKEADTMGEKARHIPASTNTLPLLTNKPFSAPVQRKVGLEIETPGLLLFSGNMRQAQQPQDPQQAPLLDDDEEDDQPFDVFDRPLEKGKAILSGPGWKLTADIIGGSGVVEFITDPVDETNDPAALGNIVRLVRAEALRVRALVAAWGYSQLARNVVVRRMPGALEGNIHITGGIKPSQIITLLGQIAGWNGGNDLNVDAGSRALLGQAVQAAQNPLGTIAGRGAAYQGLIALLGGYVGGQRRYAEMAQVAHQRINDGRHARPDYMRIRDCAGTVEIEQFMRIQDITTSDAEIAQEYPQGGKAAFFAELRTALREVIAPRAAKMMVPVLSRSSLATLKDKVQMPTVQIFTADVMTAAGEPGGNALTPLFPVGLDTPGHAARTIEAQPQITVDAWLQTIYAGQNLKFSDETKDFEKVGPSNVPCFCGIFTTREKGAVLEIRALDGRHLVPDDRWAPLADTVSQAFVALNQ